VGFWNFTCAIVLFVQGVIVMANTMVGRVLEYMGLKTPLNNPARLKLQYATNEKEV